MTRHATDTAARVAHDPSRSSRARVRAALRIFTLLAYVPLLLTDIGKIDAGSKAYVDLDRGRLLSSAVSMWDPQIAMGTVS